MLGVVFKSVAEFFNALGAIGADLKPEVRARAQKVVISAIIVTQIAAQAAQMASMSVRRLK